MRMPEEALMPYHVFEARQREIPMRNPQLYPLGNGHNQTGCLKGGSLSQKKNTYSAVQCTPLEQW